MFSLILYVAVDSTEQGLPLHRLQLTFAKFSTLVFLSLLVGAFQFFGSVVSLLVLITTMYTLKLRSKVGITILGIFYGFCCMAIAVTIAIYVYHYEHDVFASLAYVYSLIPAVLSGGGFGLYLASQVKEETEETEKCRILWFIYKSEEKQWSSRD
jgi:NAD/NADP transhydrogenase beta subunit